MLQLLYADTAPADPEGTLPLPEPPLTARALRARGREIRTHMKDAVGDVLSGNSTRFNRSTRTMSGE